MLRKGILGFVGFMLLLPYQLHSAAAPSNDLDCLIEPHEVVNLSSPVEGIVEKVFVQRGSFVKKGQPVAQLESRLEEASVALARARADMDAAVKTGEARLEFASIKLGRSEQLYAKQFISASELQEAQTEKKLAEIALANAIDNKRLAALELERAAVAQSRQTIRSPLSGVVVERFLNPGEYTAGQLKKEGPIMKIAQVDPLRVEAYAPVGLRGKIQNGMSAKVLVDAPAPIAHEARVTIVDPVVDSASSTFRVRLQLPNPNNRISAGLRCKLKF